MRKILSIYILCLLLPGGLAMAQYAPQAGIAGSTAVAKNDNKFVGWAKACSLQKGNMHIEDASLGKPTAGDYPQAVGIPDNFIVSLGDSGIATLTFESSVYNGAGPDFAVFENGFANPADPEEAFLELAFVEVSSDGVNFIRFPASSLTDITSQIPMAGVYMNARKINNLAGKYVSGFGTPFDLQELTGIPELDISHVTHIRLVDVIGSVNAHASKDKDGNIINDPYPTPIATSGFDLDAVGVYYMEGKYPSHIEAYQLLKVSFYPNPVADRLMITANGFIAAMITDAVGRMVIKTKFDNTAVVSLAKYQPGVYYINCEDSKGNRWVERITKY